MSLSSYNNGRCSVKNKGAKFSQSGSSNSGNTPSKGNAGSYSTPPGNDDRKADTGGRKGDAKRSKSNRQKERAKSVRNGTNPCTEALGPDGPPEIEILPQHGPEGLNFTLFHGQPLLATPILVASLSGFVYSTYKYVSAFVQPDRTFKQQVITALSAIGLGYAASFSPLVAMKKYFNYSQLEFHRAMKTPYTRYSYIRHLNRPGNDSRPDANARIKLKHQLNLVEVQLEYRFQLKKSVTMIICSETLSQILAPGVIAGCGSDKEAVLEAACRRLSTVNQDRRHIMTGDIIYKNTVHVARAILLSHEQQFAWKTSGVGF